jgi:hypothetical protein
MTTAFTLSVHSHYNLVPRCRTRRYCPVNQNQACLIGVTAGSSHCQDNSWALAIWFEASMTLNNLGGVREADSARLPASVLSKISGEASPLFLVEPVVGNYVRHCKIE